MVHLNNSNLQPLSNLNKSDHLQKSADMALETTLSEKEAVWLAHHLVKKKTSPTLIPPLIRKIRLSKDAIVSSSKILE